MLPWVILYMILGTTWSWYGINVWYRLRQLQELGHLYEVATIGFNCIFFPIGMLFCRFVYLTRPNPDLVEQPSDLGPDEDVTLVGLGVIIESLYRTGNENQKEKS
jgi:hypothetical protein